MTTAHIAAAQLTGPGPCARLRPGGVAMYVAKVAPTQYVIKRMPDSGRDGDNL